MTTAQLNQQVGRNPGRFPADFAFRLTEDEFTDVRARDAGWGGRRKRPRAFTEHGVLMLSSVLRSERAVAVNIQVVRLFTRMRRMLLDGRELAVRIERLERDLRAQGEDVAEVYRYLEKLVPEPPADQRRRIGYRQRGEEA